MGLKEIKEKKKEELMKKMKKSDSKNYPDEPVDISAFKFDEFVEKYPFVVVDCWSPTCPPCVMLAPIIKDLAKEYSGKVVFGKVNFMYPENQEIAIRYGIQGIPTLLVFKNGRLAGRLVGYRDKAMLKRELGL